VNSTAFVDLTSEEMTSIEGGCIEDIMAIGGSLLGGDAGALLSGNSSAIISSILSSEAGRSFVLRVSSYLLEGSRLGAIINTLFR